MNCMIDMLVEDVIKKKKRPELKDYELKLKQGKEQKPKYERSRLKLRKQTNK